MQPFEKDWAFVRSAVDELEDYLLSKSLYWPITASPGMRIPGDLPRLTLGNLLLSLKRLHGAEKDGEQRAMLESVEQQIQQVRNHWRVHWGKKAKEEMVARLSRWQNFVTELRSPVPPSWQEYAYQVRLRVILDLIKDEVDEPMPVEMVALDNLDHSLRSILTASDFIWEESLAEEFPSETYWYLYGVPNRNSQ